jgi:SAM-dependent methyltransferase
MAQQLRVNVGCGRSPTPGWYNFDNSLAVRLARFPLLPSIMRLVSAERGAFAEAAGRNGIRWAQAWRLPLPNATVEVVYSSHMFEHLDRSEADAFLREVKRVLVSGGILRLAVPDLGRLVDDYLRDRDADSFVAGTHLTMTRPRSLGKRFMMALVGPRHHLWMYDGSSLVRRLLGAGFRDAVVLPAGRTTIAAPGSLNLAERAEESIYVEGTL